MRLRKWILPAILIVLVFAVAGFVIWGSNAQAPMPEAVQALNSDQEVTVEQEEWLVFMPEGQAANTGLVFYPGGRVDYRAYAPLASEIAAQGYLVVIVPMPLNLAVLGGERAGDVIAAYPEIERWAIGGHSLGGAMAARYAHVHPEQIDGLILWAAYPPEGNDLSGRDLAVLSLYGTRDGLASPAEIEASRALLPPDAQVVAIAGANHAGFGRYGPQPGDLPADITLEEQQLRVSAETLALLGSIIESP